MGKRFFKENCLVFTFYCCSASGVVYENFQLRDRVFSCKMKFYQLQKKMMGKSFRNLCACFPSIRVG